MADREQALSDSELERYLALVGSLMRLSSTQRDEIGNELRDHLETRVEALKNAGQSADEATRNALEEFGDAAGLAMKFVTVVQQQRRRWMMRFATFSIVGVFVLIIGAMAMWPQDARFGAPNRALAQDDKQDPKQEKRASTDDNPFATSSNENPFGGTPESDRKRAEVDVVQVLNKVVDMEYKNVTFEEVLDDLRQKYGLNIVINPSAESVGLSPEDLVTLEYSGLRLETILENFLKRYDVTYEVNQPFVTIRKPRQDVVFKEQRERNRKTEIALDELTTLDFVDNEFSRVLAEIKDRHNLSIIVHESAADLGLSLDDLVTIQLSGVRLRTALENFLARFDCTYTVVDGLLVLASQDVAQHVVRTFNCAEVLTIIESQMKRDGQTSSKPNRPSSPSSDSGGAGDFMIGPKKSSSGGGSIGGDFVGGSGGGDSPQSNRKNIIMKQIGGGGLGGGGFGGGGVDMTISVGNSPRDQAKEDLKQLIMQMVSPGSWMEDGGIGQIRFIGDVLVVRHQGPELYRVGQFLDDIKNELGNAKK